MFNCIYLIKIFEVDLAVRVGEIVFPFSLTRWGCQSHIYIIITYIQATSIFFYSYGHYIDISLQSCAGLHDTTNDSYGRDKFLYVYLTTTRHGRIHRITERERKYIRIIE